MATIPMTAEQAAWLLKTLEHNRQGSLNRCQDHTLWAGDPEASQEAQDRNLANALANAKEAAVANQLQAAIRRALG